MKNLANLQTWFKTKEEAGKAQQTLWIFSSNQYIYIELNPTVRSIRPLCTIHRYSALPLYAFWTNKSWQSHAINKLAFMSSSVRRKSSIYTVKYIGKNVEGCRRRLTHNDRDWIETSAFHIKVLKILSDSRLINRLKLNHETQLAIINVTCCTQNRFEFTIKHIFLVRLVLDKNLKEANYKLRIYDHFNK